MVEPFGIVAAADLHEIAAFRVLAPVHRNNRDVRPADVRTVIS